MKSTALRHILMTAVVVVVLSAAWSVAASAQPIASGSTSLSGSHAGVVMVSDNDRNRDYGRANDGGAWNGGHARDRDSDRRDPFAPDGVLGHRSPEQHHRDVNRGWGLLGLLLFL